MSASCLAFSALVSALAKCASGMVLKSICGRANWWARGTDTWEWVSTVMLLGRVSRPGLPRLRAAVGSYLFHKSAIGTCPLDRYVRVPFVPGLARYWQAVIRVILEIKTRPDAARRSGRRA